uniref:Uncharacterized protein n=1 Tax=Taeniopygia guttata TaxID=59729 RepID=A0A674HMV8_TAEGU
MEPPSPGALLVFPLSFLLRGLFLFQRNRVPCFRDSEPLWSLARLLPLCPVAQGELEPCRSSVLRAPKRLWITALIRCPLPCHARLTEPGTPGCSSPDKSRSCPGEVTGLAGGDGADKAAGPPQLQPRHPRCSRRSKSDYTAKKKRAWLANRVGQGAVAGSQGSELWLLPVLAVASGAVLTWQQEFRAEMQISGMELQICASLPLPAVPPGGGSRPARPERGIRGAPGWV